ncbi:MAG: hypothetical protein HY805_09770 [Nitrospirae bacterium]|nr:hypothetical protein [Nitrospirota bacterium]
MNYCFKFPSPLAGEGEGGAEERGTDENEIRDVILTGFSIPAKYGRAGKAKVYEFKKNRLNKYYEQKRVEVFYTIEGDAIISVTVYVFYGKWEDVK